LSDRPSSFAPSLFFAIPAVLVLWMCQVIRVTLINSELPMQMFHSSLLELNLVYSENCGVNFGLFGDSDANQWILAGVAGLGCMVLAVIMLRRNRIPQAIAGGLILGGGLSNIYERLTQGFLFDYRASLLIARSETSSE
jgi:lipoprotein signal peptidase